MTSQDKATDVLCEHCLREQYEGRCTMCGVRL